MEGALGRTVVLGLGNVLLSDEGVGVRAVEAFNGRFRAPGGVEVMDGGTLGMELLDCIAGARNLIVMDAVKTGHPPGTVVRIGSEDVPAFFRQRISPHQVGLGDVLATAALMGEPPGEVVIIGMVPETMATGMTLSDTATSALDRMVGALVDELAGLGLPPVPEPRERKEKGI